MPIYEVTDGETGKTLELEGDSPPTEQELEEIFSSVRPKETVPTPDMGIQWPPQGAVIPPIPAGPESVPPLLRRPAEQLEPFPVPSMTTAEPGSTAVTPEAGEIDLAEKATGLAKGFGKGFLRASTVTGLPAMVPPEERPFVPEGVFAVKPEAIREEMERMTTPRTSAEETGAVAGAFAGKGIEMVSAAMGGEALIPLKFATKLPFLSRLLSLAEKAKVPTTKVAESVSRVAGQTIGGFGYGTKETLEEGKPIPEALLGGLKEAGIWTVLGGLFEARGFTKELAKLKSGIELSEAEARKIVDSGIEEEVHRLLEQQTKAFRPIPEEAKTAADVVNSADELTFADEAVKENILKHQRSKVRETMEELVEKSKARWRKANPDKELTPETESGIIETADEGSRNHASGLPSARHKNSKINAIRNAPEGYVNIYVEGDLDYFKRFNDNFSQQFGNTILWHTMGSTNSLAEKRLIKDMFHETGDEFSFVSQIKKEDLPAYLSKLREIKNEMNNVEIVLPNGRAVPMSSTMSVSTDLGSAGNLLKQTKKANKNSLTFDEALRNQYPGEAQDIIGKDLKDVYEQAGLKATTRETETAIPVSRARGSESTGVDAQGRPIAPGTQPSGPVSPPGTPPPVTPPGTPGGPEDISAQLRALRIKFAQTEGEVRALKEGGKLEEKLQTSEDKLAATKAKAEEIEAGRDELYRYSRAIGLHLEERNTIDTLIKNSKTYGDFTKAIDRMDEVLYKRQNRNIVKAVKNIISREQTRINKAIETGNRASLSYRQNMEMREYLNGLTNMPKDRVAITERTQKWFEEHPNEEVPENVAADVASLTKRNLETLNNEELQQVTRDIVQIRKEGRLKKKLETAQEKRKFEQTVDESVDELGAGKIDYVKEAAEKSKTGVAGLLRHIKEMGARIGWSSVRPERILDVLTGYKNKIFKAAVQEPLFASQAKKIQELENITNVIKGSLNRNGIDAIEAGKTYTKIGETPITYNNGMFIYANSKNANNYAHLKGMGLTEEQIKSAIDALPKEYKQSVDDMMRYYDKVQWKKVNDQFKKEHGIDMPKEENYFPIQNILTDRADVGLLQDILARASAKVPSVEKGFTISRVGSKSPFSRMDYFGTVTKNAKDVAQYVSFSDAVRNARKLLYNPKIKEAIVAKSPQAYKELSGWLDRLARGREREVSGPIDAISDFLRNNYVTSTIGFLATTVMKQTASIPVALAHVNKEYGFKAAWSSLKQPFKLNEMINGKSPFMKNRDHDFERELTEQFESGLSEEMLGAKSKFTKAKEASMVPTIAIDKASANLIWYSKYLEAMEKTGNETAAIRAADELVRKTQSLGGILYNASSFSGKGLSRGFSTFLNQPNQMVNLTIDLCKQWGMESTKDNLAKVFGYFVAPSLMTYYISQGLSFQRAKSDPVGLGEEMITSVTSGIPLFGQVFAVALNSLANTIRREQKKPTQNKSYISMVPTGLEAFVDVSKFLKKPSVEGAVDIVGKVTGLPTEQSKRTAKNIKEAIREKSVKPVLFSHYARREVDEQSYKGKKEYLINLKEKYKKLKESNPAKALEYKNRFSKYFQFFATDEERKKDEMPLTLGQYENDISDIKKEIEIAQKAGKDEMAKEKEEHLKRLYMSFNAKWKRMVGS